jgi:hypothetical protein
MALAPPRLEGEAGIPVIAVSLPGRRAGLGAVYLADVFGLGQLLNRSAGNHL